jgi:hypothetical protein
MTMDRAEAGCFAMTMNRLRAEKNLPYCTTVKGARIPSPAMPGLQAVM